MGPGTVENRNNGPLSVVFGLRATQTRFRVPDASWAILARLRGIVEAPGLYRIASRPGLEYQRVSLRIAVVRMGPRSLTANARNQ